MKVLVIWKRLSIGGINSGWRNRAKYFSKQGITTDFLYYEDKGGKELMEEVSTIYVTENEDETIQIIQNNNYDIIIIVDFREMYPIIRKANFRGKIILESRVPHKRHTRSQLSHFYGIKPSLIVVPSAYQKQILKPVASIPIEVIYNSIDTTFFSKIEDENLIMNEEPIIPENKKIIGWVGNLLDQQKQWKKHLNFIRNIMTSRDDLQFWIIGGENSAEKEEFIQRMKKLKIERYIRWMPAVQYTEMPLIYSKIHFSGGCLFSTTKRESFGNIFVEAMACGCPVIAPHITAVPEVVKNNETGLLYKPWFQASAEKKLYRILDNSSLREEIINNGMKDVRQRFSIEVSAKKYVELLQRLKHS